MWVGVTWNLTFSIQAFGRVHFSSEWQKNARGRCSIIISPPRMDQDFLLSRRQTSRKKKNHISRVWYTWSVLASSGCSCVFTFNSFCVLCIHVSFAGVNSVLSSFYYLQCGVRIHFLYRCEFRAVLFLFVLYDVWRIDKSHVYSVCIVLTKERGFCLCAFYFEAVWRFLAHMQFYRGRRLVHCTDVSLWKWKVKTQLTALQG